MELSIALAIIGVIGTIGGTVVGAVMTNRTTKKVAQQQRENQARLRQCEPWGNLGEFVSQKRDDILHTDYKQMGSPFIAVTVDGQDVISALRKKLKSIEYMMYDKAARDYVNVLYKDLEDIHYDPNKDQFPNVYDHKSFYVAVLWDALKRIDTIARYSTEMLYKGKSSIALMPPQGLFTKHGGSASQR